MTTSGFTGLRDVWHEGWQWICPVCKLLAKSSTVCRGEGTMEPHAPRRRVPWTEPGTGK